MTKTYSYYTSCLRSVGTASSFLKGQSPACEAILSFVPWHLSTINLRPLLSSSSEQPQKGPSSARGGGHPVSTGPMHFSSARHGHCLAYIPKQGWRRPRAGEPAVLTSHGPLPLRVEHCKEIHYLY